MSVTSGNDTTALRLDTSLEFFPQGSRCRGNPGLKDGTALRLVHDQKRWRNPIPEEFAPRKTCGYPPSALCFAAAATARRRSTFCSKVSPGTGPVSTTPQ
jgi:hypothetical protein